MTRLLAALIVFVSTSAAFSQDTRPTISGIDAAGRFVVGGKPVFMNGWYSDGTLERLRRLAAGGFNTVLDYGLTARPIEDTRRYLAEAEKLGVMVIACFNDVYPSATHRTELGEWKGNAAILEGVLDVVRKSPAVVAYYNNDELPDAKQAEIEGYYRRIKELDPSRPQIMVHDRTEAFAVFSKAADFFGYDHYPIPQHGPGAFGPRFAAAKSGVPAGRPLIAVLQNFAWYQHRKPVEPVVHGDLETERARLPHAEEWRASRPPTADECRAMHYVALVSGAQGVLWWCLYNLDYLPDRVERFDAACRLAAETNALAPWLLATDGGPLAWSDPRIVALEKRTASGRILIAVNTADEPLRASATVDATAAAGAAASRPESGPAAPRLRNKVDVLFESRLVGVEDGVLTDFFAPYARHVYRLD